MQEQIEIRNLLMARLEAKRAKNPRYSLRAFANSIDMSNSALSEVINGKRRISLKKFMQLAERLCLAPDEVDYYAQLFNNKKKSETPPQTNANSLQLSAQAFRVISEWHHFAILSVVDLDEFESSNEWIARRLGIGLKEVEQAVDRLLHLDLLFYEDGVLKSTGEVVASPDGVAEISLRKSHFKNLELAEESLNRDRVEDRDFTAITMAIDPEKIPEARKRIRKFRDELCQFLNSEKKSEVYKFCMQLFPLTKLQKVGSKNGEKK